MIRLPGRPPGKRGDFGKTCQILQNSRHRVQTLMLRAKEECPRQTSIPIGPQPAKSHLEIGGFCGRIAQIIAFWDQTPAI